MRRLIKLIRPMRPIGPIGLMRPIGLIRPMRLIGLIGLIGLMGCSGESTLEPEEPKRETGMAITFSGLQGEEQAISQGTRAYEANRANRANEAYGAYRITRAGTPLSEAATTFTVWGYKNDSYDNVTGYGGLQKVFPGYTVNWLDNTASTTTNSHGWEYVAQQQQGQDEQTIKYWDWNAKAYRFFAVATTTNETNGAYVANGAHEANVPHEPNDPNGPYEFTFEADCSGTTEAAIAANIAKAPFYTRLWFSTGNAADYPNQQFGKPVQLEFLKPFAKVRFMFRYSYSQESVKVEDPVFKPSADFDASTPAGIPLKGTFKVIYPLTGTATCEDFEATPAADNRPVEAPTVANRLEAFEEEYIPEGTEKWYTVLPVKSQSSYTLSVKVNKAEKRCTVPAEYMTWLPGYSYTYIFKITEDGGVEIDMVQSAVTTWTELGTTHTVYNW